MPIVNYHRYHGYDYSRGATVFITVSLEPRLPIFGEVRGSEMVLSPFGRAVEQVLLQAPAHVPGVVLRRYVVMPDHVHFRLTLAPNLPEPLRMLGQFVGGFKQFSRKAVNALGHPGPIWQKNYHDRLCLSEYIIRKVDLYIENNPLKWGEMKGPNPPLRVREPLASERLPADEWWTGVGRLDLLDPGSRIAALRLSRRIPLERYDEVLERCRTAVARGFVLASTWISPCERYVWNVLQGFDDVLLIRMSPDPMNRVHRPTEDEPQLFAANRYLRISRQADPDCRRVDAWHGVDSALAGMALAGGGVALYVLPRDGGGGELEYRFST